MSVFGKLNPIQNFKTTILTKSFDVGLWKTKIKCKHKEKARVNYQLGYDAIVNHNQMSNYDFNNNNNNNK